MKDEGLIQFLICVNILTEPIKGRNAFVYDFVR